MFLINGVIQAHGNITNKIIFDGNSNFFKTNHPVAKGFVDLNYCIIRNGQSAFWFDNTGSFNLTKSELSNLSQSSYLWYPSQDTFIEYNSFTNTAGIKIGTDGFSSHSPGAVYIKYNLFNSNQGFIINNYASYGSSKTIVNNNSFTNTAGIILEVEKTATTADMDASQNYCGTTNTIIIDYMIYDKNDDVSCLASLIICLCLMHQTLRLLSRQLPRPPLHQLQLQFLLRQALLKQRLRPQPLLIQSPNPLTSTNTPTPTETTATSSATDQTDNPTITISNPTVNPSGALNNADPSNRVAIPEFSLWGVVLILFAAGSLSVVMLKRKKLKLTEE